MLEGYKRPERFKDEVDLTGLLHLIEQKQRPPEMDVAAFEKSGLYKPGEPTTDFEKARNLVNTKLLDNNARENNSYVVAKVFEGITAEAIDRFSWLGDSVYAQPASLYDDQKGIDTVIEYTQPYSATRSKVNYTGFGIDLTYSNWFGQKTAKIREMVLSSNLPEIKYFISEIDGQPKRASDTPLLVVTAALETILDLGQLWSECQSIDMPIKKQAKDKLKDHPYKNQLIALLAGQSKIIRDFASDHGQRLVADAYDNVNQLMISLPGNNTPTPRDGSFSPTIEHFKKVFR